MLDDAITSFESVLATKVPSRKFDFSADYRVIDELGSALYARARLELPVTIPVRREYLQKAIAAYRRTLAIDSEDVSAHWGLAQAYSDPAWGGKTAALAPLPDGGDQAVPPGPDTLRKLATSIADLRATATERQSLALRLAHDVDRFMDGPRPRYESRLEPLHEIVEVLGRAWNAAETDPETLAALAQALKVTHNQLHERLKPDETAEGRAFRLARQRDPAANLNAQSIVIHPLHRVGAPGIDQPVMRALPIQSAQSPTTMTAAAGAAPAPENSR